MTSPRNPGLIDSHPFRMVALSKRARPCLSFTSQKLCDRFGPRPDLKFFVDAADVGVNGFVADAKLLGDFFVEKTVAETVEHFLLALRKVLGRLWRGTGLLERLDDFARDMRGHGRTTTLHFVDGFEQLG